MDVFFYCGLGVIGSALCLILYGIWQERRSHVWRRPDRR